MKENKSGNYKKKYNYCVYFGGIFGRITYTIFFISVEHI